ncbi:MAG: prolyl oligopeptidase family serine peptidase [Chthonomonadales bacterium]
MAHLDALPLIPRELLFGNPERTSATVSPDGTRLAYLAPLEGVLNVWVRTLGQNDDRVVTRDRKRGIRLYTWAFNNRHLLYLQDFNGDENWHVWSVDLVEGRIRDLTPFDGVRAEILALDPRYPDEMLVALNVRDARFHDVYRVNLDKGTGVLEIVNPGDVVGWLADAHFEVRGAYRALPDGGFELAVRDSGGSADVAHWRPLITWGPDEEGRPYAFTEDGDALYVASSIGSDTVELRLVRADTGAETVLASDSRVDLSDVLMHPLEHRVQAAGFNLDRLEWRPLDEAVAADLEWLQSQGRGELHVEARSLDDRLWVVLYVQDQAPAAYFLYRRGEARLDYLFTTRPALEKYPLAEMRPVHIQARDGLTLHGYLTLPPGAEARNLPLVLNVHGGPWSRDTWGYDAEAQWLANRGYACLQVNYRGSTGYGKKFLHAGDKEWGGKMHDDLIDAVHWAVEHSIADPRRVGIFGGSYGGYAALAGAAFTPDVFACAVDVVGPSNILTLIASIPPYWEPLKRLFAVRVGDTDADRDLLMQRSPLFSADRIQCPLLIAQGANDPRVKRTESEQIVAALRERGKDVEYLLFEDEGHGFARPENRLRFYAVAEKFLARWLGGRVEE